MGFRSVKIDRADSRLCGRNNLVRAKHQGAWEGEDAAGTGSGFEALLNRFAQALWVSPLIEVIPFGAKIIQVDPVFRELINLQV